MPRSPAVSPSAAVGAETVKGPATAPILLMPCHPAQESVAAGGGSEIGPHRHDDARAEAVAETHEARARHESGR